MMKLDKKKIIIIGISIVTITIISILIYLFFIKSYDISIEVAASNKKIGYIYGPNKETRMTIPKNSNAKLKIITEKQKKAKCYSTNEEILKVENDVITTINSGSAEVYCKLRNSKSNSILITVQ